MRLLERLFDFSHFLLSSHDVYRQCTGKECAERFLWCGIGQYHVYVGHAQCPCVARDDDGTARPPSCPLTFLPTSGGRCVDGLWFAGLGG